MDPDRLHDAGARRLRNAWPGGPVMPEEELFDPPAPRLPGYAPRLCTHGPAHYARRDLEAAGVVWMCTECGLRWKTNGEQP